MKLKKVNAVQIIGLLATILGVAASALGDLATSKQIEDEVREQVQAALAERNEEES